MSKKLVLFDIDGTLISPGPAARKAINQAIGDYIGVQPNLQIKDVAGLTDRLIVKNSLMKFGKNIDNAVIDSIVQNYLTLFERGYTESDGAFIYEDAIKLVEKVRTNNIPFGLLTGNMRRGAEIKLGKFNLMRHFMVGAFAEDGMTRNDLPGAAKQKASEYYKTNFENENVILVGDTPEDAVAAKTNGCQSIVVCRRTEWYNDIVAAGADLVVNSLDDPKIEKDYLL